MIKSKWSIWKSWIHNIRNKCNDWVIISSSQMMKQMKDDEMEKKDRIIESL